MLIGRRKVRITGVMMIKSNSILQKILFLTLLSGDLYLVKNDHVGYRYQILDILGKGSFGQVAKVYDHKKKNECAIKIINGHEKFYNQALVEIQLLKHIRENDPDD